MGVKKNNKSSVKSMTSGVPITLILSFAIPLFFGNLFQQTYNMIDSAIVGRALGADALAAVGSTSSIQYLVLGFCIGGGAGFAIPVAKSFGGEKREAMRKHVYHATIMSILLAVVLTISTCLLCVPILHLLKVPENIFQDAYRYLIIIFIGVPFIMLYNLCAGMLRAVGNSKTPFYCLMIGVVLNIGLDFLCIVKLKWGCAGAAAATVTSQCVSGVLCAAHIFRKTRLLLPKKEERKLTGEGMKIMLIQGLPMGFQYSITAIGIMSMQAANNALGSVFVSANTVAGRIRVFAMCPFDAIATGVSVFCGQNLGAGKFDRMRKGLREGMAVAVGYGLAAGCIIWFLAPYLCRIFLSANEVETLQYAAREVKLQCLFLFALGFLNVGRMTMQGIGYAARALFCGVLELATRVTIALVFVPKEGFDAVIAADPAPWIVAALFVTPMTFYLIKKLERLAKT